jgi:hypothetical protein
MFFRKLPLLCILALSLSAFSVVSADQGYDDANYYNDDAAAADDGAAANDDGAAADDGAAQNYYDGFGAGDDYIKYWTDYAILPKRCIV